MLSLLHDIACCISVLFICNLVNADYPSYVNYQHKTLDIPHRQFSISEYPDEYTDTSDRDKGSLTSQTDLVSNTGHVSESGTNTVVDSSDGLNKNIVWDSNWAHNLKFGQISAVSIDPAGNVGVFHRGSRIWGATTFDRDNKYVPNDGVIPVNTIVLLDKSGKKLLEWGRNMFYLPHGLTIDSYGNYWVTDVALHQVFKFDAEDISVMKVKQLRKRQYNLESKFHNTRNANNMLQNYDPQPSLVLGEMLHPGNDDKHFCKPTAVAVQSNGDFFVSDGYCNHRIIKYNSKGEKILQWGRSWGGAESMYTKTPPPNAFYVPHALALASEHNLIFVADRENGRVLSFSANNGTFQKEYRHPTIGTKIYSVAYAKDKLYLINGPPSNYNVHVKGFVVDVSTGELLSQFGPGHDMDRPHDIAVTEDGSEIYVVELNIQTMYRFLQDINASVQTGKSVITMKPRHEPAPLMDSNTNNPSFGGTTTATLVLSLVTAAVIFIALCVAIAAVVARCQKRGCLLIMRKRMHWEAERREIFKLSSLLEGRRGKGFKIFEKRPNPRDFSKLNTEPETSEDEHPENSLMRVI